MMNKYFDNFFRNRGIIYNQGLFIDKFEDEKLKDIDLLSDKLFEAKENKTITILPDFDMDGIMAGTIFYAGLCELGFSVNLFTPSTDRYGFDARTIDALVERFPNTDIILTCDVGVTCFEGVRRAKELGLDIYVTDHHKQESDASNRLIEADVHVNPMRLDETYPMPNICGAFVAFKVLMEYVSKYSLDSYEVIRRLVLFAGVGTVSDSMPMVGENRFVVKSSLFLARLLFSDENPWFLNSIIENSSKAYAKAFSGFYYILSAFKELGKIENSNDIKEDFYGFYLAPTFNSVKRLHSQIEYAFGVFFSDFKEKCFENLIFLNDKRKDLVKEHIDAILSIDNPYAPYFYFTDADEGLHGLLATELLKRTNCPVAVMRVNDDGFSGSGRSPEWFAFNTFLNDNGAIARGHEHAFGTRIGFDALPFIYKNLENEILNMDFDVTSEKQYDVDIDFRDNAVLDMAEVCEFLSDIEDFRPFGPRFESPTARIRFKRKEAYITLIGDSKQHLCMMFPSLKILGWNKSALFDSYMDMDDEDEIVITGSISLNFFRGEGCINITMN